MVENFIVHQIIGIGIINELLCVIASLVRLLYKVSGLLKEDSNHLHY